MKKSYLVTGGTGFLGSALVHRLVDGGYFVRVLDNNIRGNLHRLSDLQGRFEFCEADIRDPIAVEKACKDIDSVIHLAYINGTQYFYSHPELVLDIAVSGMMNVLKGCIQQNVGELVLASSSEVYQTPPTVPTDEKVPLSVPDPHNPRYSYGGGKIICELLALNYGKKFFQRVLIFRPHNVYGPDMGWEHVIPQFTLRMKKLAEGTQGVIPFPIQGSGRETRAFIHIQDFTDGLQILLEKGEHLEIYHIGKMEEIPMAEVAQLVASCFNREIVIQTGESPAGATPRRCADIAKLSALGFNPAINLEQGLPPVVGWYSENAHLAPVSGII